MFFLRPCCCLKRKLNFYNPDGEEPSVDPTDEPAGVRIVRAWEAQVLRSPNGVYLVTNSSLESSVTLVIPKEGGHLTKMNDNSTDCVTIQDVEPGMLMLVKWDRGQNSGLEKIHAEAGDIIEIRGSKVEMYGLRNLSTRKSAVIRLIPILIN